MSNPSDRSSTFVPFPKQKVNLALERKTTRANALQGGPTVTTEQGLPLTQTVAPQNPVPMSAAIAPPEAVLKNPDLLSVDLPSNFLFYSFKELRVELIKGRHQAKFARAAETRNMQTLVEAVSSTIGTPGVTAFDLTVPDFYWLLYWHKLNSFTKSKFINTTECDNPEHRREVFEGKKSPESLVIQTYINKSSLVETKLDVIPDLVAESNLPASLRLKPPLMRDIIDYVDHPNGEEPELQLLGQFATMVDGITQTLPFNDRLTLVEDLTADQLQFLRDYETSINNYGIEETINVKCKECGASKTVRLSIDAFSFLPS